MNHYMIVTKAVHMAQMMSIPVLGLIENYSYYQCPDCGAKHAIFGESHLEQEAMQLGLPCWAQLPIDSELAAAIVWARRRLFPSITWRAWRSSWTCKRSVNVRRGRTAQTEHRGLGGRAGAPPGPLCPLCALGGRLTEADRQYKIKKPQTKFQHRGAGGPFPAEIEGRVRRPQSLTPDPGNA